MCEDSRSFTAHRGDAQMLFFDGAFGLLLIGLWLFCLFDVITTDSAVVRNLPKLLWLFIVLVLPDIGSILWLVAGRPWNGGTSNLPYKGNIGRSARAEPTRRTAATNPDDDEDFLRGLRDRAEQQRRRAAEPPHGSDTEDGPAQ
jgi:hypothetical protein